MFLKYFLFVEHIIHHSYFMVHVIRWGKKYFSLKKNQVNYKHAPDKRDFNCVECIRRRRSCHTCHTVNVCDSRRSSLELREEAQWQKTDVISGLRSCQHVSANNGRYAGLPFFCLPGMRSSLYCRRGFTGGSCDKPAVFPKNLNGDLWWKPRPEWNSGPRL